MTLQSELFWYNLELEHRASVAQQFARYALALQYESLPPEVVVMAKRLTLDALACAVGASNAPGRPMVEAVVRDLGGTPEATVYGSGFRTTAMNACLVNNFLTRYLDYNDNGGGCHSNEAVPSLLAVAERERSDGRSFLTALVISVELGFRIREATIGPRLADRGWNSDSRVGLTMPAPVGKLMGLTEEQIAHATGIAGLHTAGLMIIDATHEEMTMRKNLRFCIPAQQAILGCMLAKRGFTGPVRIVEGEGGFKQVVLNNDLDLHRLVDFSGWRILRNHFKTICMCWPRHANVLATIAIVTENDLKPDDIVAVHLKTDPYDAAEIASSAEKYPRNTEMASHSAYFGNAIAIVERACGPDQYRPEVFKDPVLLEQIEKITVEADASLPQRCGITEITTRDGRHFVKRIDIPRGDARNPMTNAELEDKFRDAARHVMTSDRIDSIIETVWSLDKMKTLDGLARLMAWEQA